MVAASAASRTESHLSHSLTYSLIHSLSSLSISSCRRLLKLTKEFVRDLQTSPLQRILSEFFGSSLSNARGVIPSTLAFMAFIDFIACHGLAVFGKVHVWLHHVPTATRHTYAAMCFRDSGGHSSCDMHVEYTLKPSQRQRQPLTCMFPTRRLPTAPWQNQMPKKTLIPTPRNDTA